ncbi:MAG TPA: BTAD domain-containing putative transcriptional regulator [Candidatus Acidoferrales bacterium]|nr:BTAD domain-containing putative transcriptional regulator [Candidatus Acidoferrales bacterium]
MKSDAAHAVFRIHLFAQTRFVFDGNPFKFSAPPRTLPLLAYLVMHRAAYLTREQIAFALWPDDKEDEAREKLRRHIYHLRRALPRSETPWIVVEDRTVRWNERADAWIDVNAFETCLSAARMDEAAQHYQGDLLPALYDDWILAARERFRSRYLALLVHLAEEASRRGDVHGGASFVHRLLAEDPWREDALRQLMRIRYKAGDRAGAIQAFRHFEERLRCEMRCEVMPETRALRDAIAGSRGPARLHAPPYDVISDPFAELSAKARRLAEIAATIGVSFDIEILRELCGWNECDLLDALDELQDRRLVRESPSRATFDYEFSHRLVYAAAYALAPPERRRRRHRRIARLLQRLHPNHPQITHLLTLHRQQAESVPAVARTSPGPVGVVANAY